jgi:hypothetical protein
MALKAAARRVEEHFLLTVISSDIVKDMEEGYY